MKPTQSLTWPRRYLPAAVPPYAGTYPMTVPGCNRVYDHATVALHLHDYCGELWIADRLYRIQPGDITLTTGLSRYALTESGTHLCIHFQPPRSTSRGSNTAPNIRLPLHFRLGPQVAAARERFWRIIDHARRSNQNPDSPAGCAASASLQEFLLWLYLQSRRGATPHRSSLVDAALSKLGEAIESSLAKPLLIGDLAKGVGLSADYVARLFARRYGMTLQHYLLLRRIELARHLLVSSDLLVSEIGCQVGLPDPQYFNKQFRRVVGLSPVAFRAWRGQEPHRRLKLPRRNKFAAPNGLAAKKPHPRNRSRPRPNRRRPAA
jgi:AraC-like DNA-binding protein